MDKFLDNFYGALFSPSETFEKIKANPNLVQALIIVVFISSLNKFFTLSFDSGYHTFLLINSIIGGLVSWLFFAVFIETVAVIFNASRNLKILLCLTAFALIPWMFLAPIKLLAGNVILKLLAVFLKLGCWIWSAILGLLAIKTTFDLSFIKAALLVLISFPASIIALYLIVHFFSTLIMIFS